MQIDSLRFVKTSNPDCNADKQYNVLANEEEFVRCDLTKRTIAKPIELFNVNDGMTRTLTPEKKFLNTRWHLTSQDAGEAGEIALKGTDAWLARDMMQNELFRVVDPRKWSEKTLEAAMGSWPDSYALVVDGRGIGIIRRALRPGEEEPKTRLQKLTGLFKDRDWFLELSQPAPMQSAYRMIASVLLLVEVTVSGARAG
ncbi:hypothetical protein ABVF61_18435 [Roseibium sp. HPY-6]|uniref:hypothetical protein n=1 Tax=Roseibium sp. HPY-6 TaxID=3229852 RepID=UPI00338E482D